jgi:glycosyltransferase involved in cell wall biosynthesis
MYKVGICGHFGEGHNLLNGQTIKTKIFAEELSKIYGGDQILKADTHKWKKSPITVLLRCIALFVKCESVIILPAHNGVRVLIPFFAALNCLFKRKLIYIVIGGWLPDLLKKNTRLKASAKRFDGIYVETHKIIDELKMLGLNNMFILPNFKQLRILDQSELVYVSEPPYKLCTFSRVTDKKGIEDAIEVIKTINDRFGKTVYSLDIYGPIDPTYSDRFQTIINTLPEYIKYKGSIDYNESVNVIKDYFLLLFPTRYFTEGIPGTIIDAYAAGVPVAASGWNSAEEIIENGVTGFIYGFMKNNELEDILLHAVQEPETINDMKIKCLNRAQNYRPETVIKDFAKDAIK